MSDSVNEIEDIVKLAKDLGVRIVLSAAHEYHNVEGTEAKADEIRKIAKQLIELKRKVILS
jgi:ribosomal protein L17